MALDRIKFNIASFNDADAGGNNYYAGIVYEVFNSNDTLADIYSDAAGANPINQDGISNKSNSSGEVVFYIDSGDYYIKVNEKVEYFSTLLSSGAMINNLSLPYVFDTVADLAANTAVFPDGKIIIVTERANGVFTYATGGTANGYDIINAGNGNVAIYFRCGTVRLEHLGASSNLINNAPAINAALAYGGDVQGDKGVVYPVTGNLKPKSNSTIRDIKVTVGAVWNDDTGDNSVLRRGVVNYSGLENVDTYNFDVTDDFNSATDLAITAFLITGCNNVHFYKCRADHTAARTRTYAPFDFEGGNTNCSWNKGYAKNEAGELGGCWLRAISGASSGLKVTDSEFDKMAGDEILAVFGVLNKISDVEIYGSTFRSKSGVTQGTSISIFPLSAGPNAAVENVRFHDNTLIAAGFTDSAYRIGDSADAAYLCDNIQTYNNTFVITNALPTSDVIRFVNNVGSNVNFRDNSVKWGDAKHCRATITGNFKDVAGNTIRDYAINTFSSCDHVHDNIDCINSYQTGQVFLNVDTFVNNICEAGSAGQIFGSGMRSRVKGNTLKVNGTSYAFSYNGLNVDNPSFDIDNNDIQTTSILDVCVQFDTNTISKSKLVGNRWKGIQATEYFTGRGNSFDVVKGNSWWSFTDESRSSVPFVKTSYTKMFPLGAFINNDAIGSTTGLVTLGWSKQEANAVSADWKAVKVTI